MAYSGIAVPFYQIKNMKNILTTCHIIVFSLCITCKSSSAELPKHKTILNAKTPICTKSNNINVDSTANFSISIQGKQNLVTVKTDSLTVQTSESITNQSKDSNSITINGKGNSVSVNQETKGKIAVKQSGNNNRINISQSSHQP